MSSARAFTSSSESPIRPRRAARVDPTGSQALQAPGVRGERSCSETSGDGICRASCVRRHSAHGPIVVPSSDHVRPWGFQSFRARALRARHHPAPPAIRPVGHARVLRSLREPGVTRAPRHRSERLVGLRQRLQHEIPRGGIEPAGAPHALSDRSSGLVPERPYGQGRGSPAARAFGGRLESLSSFHD